MVMTHPCLVGQAEAMVAAHPCLAGQRSRRSFESWGEWTIRGGTGCASSRCSWRRCLFENPLSSKLQMKAKERRGATKKGRGEFLAPEPLLQPDPPLWLRRTRLETPSVSSSAGSCPPSIMSTLGCGDLVARTVNERQDRDCPCIVGICDWASSGTCESFVSSSEIMA